MCPSRSGDFAGRNVSGLAAWIWLLPAAIVACSAHDPFETNFQSFLTAAEMRFAQPDDMKLKRQMEVLGRQLMQEAGCERVLRRIPVCAQRGEELQAVYLAELLVGLMTPDTSRRIREILEVEPELLRVEGRCFRSHCPTCDGLLVQK